MIQGITERLSGSNAASEHLCMAESFKVIIKLQRMIQYFVKLW